DIVWIYDKDLEQATRQKQKPDNTSPALLLSSPNQRLLQGFTITEIKNTGFLLKPKKSQDALFSRLLLQFNQDQLQSLKIEDKLGQITLITFSQIKTNLSLPENTFQFTPPSGVDVIEN
ncbi:MAG: outer-membrane lipoprotein carrier protein LolA, partial [Gammaproteobacteria bacterium]|nr:outer-membrane lipoprotein carrier protein LolA [Gammaproteobacteria bacterium]